MKYESKTVDVVDGFDVMEFNTDINFVENDAGEKVIYPFGPPLFQTWVSQEFSDILLNEGRRLKIETDDANFKLAGNLKYGRSFNYSDEFRKKCEPYILSRVASFLNMLPKSGHNIKDLEMKSFWINFSKKHDFNPTHDHDGVFSFVIYCDVPSEIFNVQADSNSQHAGKIIFEYGEKISEETRCSYSVVPFNNLMFIFNAELRHNVPPYWVDAERISVSGNIVIKK